MLGRDQHDQVGRWGRPPPVKELERDMRRLLDGGRAGAATAVQLFERFRKVSGPRPSAAGSWQTAQAPSYELCRLAMIAFKQSGADDMVGRMWRHLEYVRSQGLRPDARMLAFVISACAADDPGSARNAFVATHCLTAMQRGGWTPSFMSYAGTISACASGKEHGHAIRVLKEWHARGIRLDGQREEERLHSIYNELVLACARKRRMEDATFLLGSAEQHDIDLSLHHLQDLLYFACEQHRPDVLRLCIKPLVRGTLKQAGVVRYLRMEEGAMLAVLNVAATHRDPELARQAWRLLVRTTSLPPARWRNNPPIGRVQEVARREAEEIERLERAAMGGMLVPAESASQGTAAEPFADPAASASAPQLGAAAEPYPEMASRPAAEQMAADGQSAAVGQQHPAEPDVGELPETATANGVLQQGRIEGAPSAPCFHAFIHAHAAAGDLRGALVGVAELLAAHGGTPSAASYHRSLGSLVDAMAERGAPHVDDALRVLHDLHQEGQPVAILMLNCIIAAFSQVGNLARAFETFEAASGLGLAPDTDSYNALMEGLVNHGQAAALPKLRTELEAAGLTPSRRTYELLTRSHIVRRDVAAMLASLREMEAAGHEPPVALLETCLARAERQGDEAAIKRVMDALELQAYKIIGAAAKVRRWQEEGGMHILTGSHRFRARETSGGYKHPHQVQGLIPPRIIPEEHAAAEHDKYWESLRDGASQQILDQSDQHQDQLQHS